MEIPTARRIFRFGVFEADEQTGELRKQGRRLALQGQPLQLLLLLLTRPGELITRTEFQQLLWPDGTFVDFDHSLNTAVAKIREALGDSASRPRFVETLARRGYRFIAPVEVLDAALPAAAISQNVPATSLNVAPPAADSAPLAGASAATAALPTPAFSAAPAPVATDSAAPAIAGPAPIAEAPDSTTLLTRPDELPHPSGRLVRSLFLLLQVMYLCFYVASLARLNHVEDAIRGVVSHTLWAVVVLLVTAVVGIPIRLYLIAAAGFNIPGLRPRYLRLFPVVYVLDEIWALAPFLLAQQIGYGLALGATAALLYVPFAQRSLILMGAGAPALRLAASTNPDPRA
jgi:DNA-binding winged helix-turn-helix (wHTH) protein